MLRLLEEAGVLEGFDAKGEPVFAEAAPGAQPRGAPLRLGQWWEGLYLHAGASPEDVRQYHAFFARGGPLGGLAMRRPRPQGLQPSPDPAAPTHPRCGPWTASASPQWLDAARPDLAAAALARWTTPAGTTTVPGLDTTSAWAGLFYFAARKTRARRGDAAPAHLARGQRVPGEPPPGRCGDRCAAAVLATAIRQEKDGTPGAGLGCRNQRAPGLAGPARDLRRAACIMARRVIPGLAEARPAAAFFQEFLPSAWLVANLTLRERAPRSAPSPWPGTTCSGTARPWATWSPPTRACATTAPRCGPTTTPSPAPTARGAGSACRRSAWPACVRLILEDLRPGPPGSGRPASPRLDVMRWGHAMVRPAPGFMWSRLPGAGPEPFGHIHFAHSDLCGFALFEEAQDHGLRAAEEVLAASGRRGESWR